MSKTRNKTERGVILIFTLWILATLSLLLLGFTHRVRLEVSLCRYQAKDKEVFYLANSGINQAILRLSRDNNIYDSLNEDWRQDYYQWRDSDEQEGTYTIIDEESKVNINKAPLEMLMRLPGINAEIASSIIDWRDEDKNPLAQGAEESYYQTLAQPYHCKNAPFDQIEELLLVKGITPILFYGEDANHNGTLDPNENDGLLSTPDDNMDGVLQPGLKDLVTVSSIGLININTASPEVLSAIPGLSKTTVENIILYRSGPDRIEKTPDDTPFEQIKDIEKVPGITAYEVFQIMKFVTVSSANFTIISEVILRKDALKKTLIATIGKNGNTIKITAWQEY